MSEVAVILSRLEVSRSGGGWRSKCPLHCCGEQEEPLRIWEPEDGKVLLECDNGCAPEAICAALGLTSADLHVEQPLAPVRERFDYHDRNGDMLFQITRDRVGDHRLGRPNLLACSVGVARPGEEFRGPVLYRLPRVLAAPKHEPVFLVEFEADVDALEKLGLVATCHPFGTGEWREEYADALRGKRVMFLPINDKAGLLHFLLISSAILESGVKTGAIFLPDLPPGGGVRNWLAYGGSAHDLRRIGMDDNSPGTASVAA